MANREIRYLFRKKETSGCTLPSGALIGEPFVNTFEGRMFFSGNSNGSYIPVCGQTNVFEVGANVDFVYAKSGITTPYIDFQSGNTVDASPVAGRVYFDYSENALSYYPYTNHMDVTLNIGQEELIRIYNDSGTAILNGQVVSINGTHINQFSGTPTVVLAISTDVTGDTAVVSGVATHRIENGEYGFITKFGIVRDLNLSAFSNGDVVYLSDTTAGGLNLVHNLLNTSRQCKVGRVISNDPINGKLLVDIENEIGSVYGISKKQETVFSLDNTSTGLIIFTGISASTSFFNVAPVKGWVVDNVTDPCYPTVKPVYYTGATGLTSLYLSGYNGTYLLIDSASTLFMQSTMPTAKQRRENLYLGKVTHPNKSTYTGVQHQLVSMLSPYQSTYDMFSSLKFIKDGLLCSANGANLKINISNGKLYGLGINFPYSASTPNEIYYSSLSPATFRYRTQTGGTAADTTDIDPLNYDVGGVITAIPGSILRAQNQRIYIFPGGEIRIGYGQNYYNSLTEAISNVQNEAFVEYSNFAENAMLLGILSVTKGCTDLSDSTKARFILVSKFGENIGGSAGITTATLQTAYNNSTYPEILTDSTLGAVNFRRGSAADTDAVITVQNNAGDDNVVIRGDGYFSAVTVNANYVNAGVFSGDTYYANSLSGSTEKIITTSGSSLLQSYLTTDSEWITNSTVIYSLLSSSNWLYNTYTGSTTGLVEGQKYACCNYLYIYTNSTLYRYKNANPTISLYSSYTTAGTNSDVVFVSGATPFTLMMPAASSLVLGECRLKNIGPADVTLSATSSTFDGNTSLTATTGSSYCLVAYVNNYYLL